MSDDATNQRDTNAEDYGQELRQAGFAARTEEEQRALLEAADAEPEDDEGDEELDEELREGYGLDAAAPWAPVPIARAREFLRAHPDARLQLTFPNVYQEDRGQLVRDALALQGSGVLSLHTISHLVAPEFGLDTFDFAAEQRTIAQERTRFGDVLGSGDDLARRVGAMPDDGDEEDAPELRRQDLAAPDRARFRRQQRETRTLFVERDERGLIRSLTEKPGEPPAGFDAEQFYQQRRSELQTRRTEAETAADKRRVQHRREVLAEGKKLAELLRKAKEQTRQLRPSTEPVWQPWEKVNKVFVHYRYANPGEQTVKFGHVLEACGICEHFIKPASCERVEGTIAPEMVCDLFMPRRKPAR